MVAYAGVYEIRNTTNEHSYIGSSINIAGRLVNHKKALKKHQHSNVYLQNAYNKYGEESFVFSPLLYCDSNNTLFFEQMCFDGLCPQYNFGKTAVAPMLGITLTKEQKRKLSIAMIGNKNGVGLKGHEQSEEHKRKLSESQKGKPRYEWIGRHHTKKTKQLMSIAAKNRSYRPLSEEHKLNISKSNKGKVCSEETKQKMSESAKQRWAEVRGEI